MNQEPSTSIFTLVVIRCFDLLFSVIALVALSPLFLLIAIALRFSGEGEVFFCQERIGKEGQNIKLFKFATMLKNSQAIGTGELTIPNDPRVLPFGRILRKTKLNELPQLFNVLAGDLSLIGPRPQTRRYHDLFWATDRAWINAVRPGLSGVGSILFRDEETILSNVADPATFDDQIITPYKGQVEHWFAMNHSVGLYFELIIITVLVVILPSCRLHQRLLCRVPAPPEVLSELLMN